MEKRKVPAVRFKGFEDDWEQRKLKDLSDFITKGATPTTYGFEWQASGIPFFRNDAIKDNQFIYGDFSYISEDANEVLQRSEIHADDILVAITGDIGKVGIVPKNIEKGNINQHTARIRIVKDAIPYFVYQSLITEVHQKRYQIIKTGLSMPQLSLEQIRENVVLCPSLSEQHKIGLYFERLDLLITLHQRKLEKLYTVKKSMLEKMFPKNGSKIPEIRFEGFTDDWEQRKLGEVYTERNEKGQDDLEILSVSIHHGVSNGELDADLLGKNIRRSEDKSLYKHVYYGDLVFNMMRAWQGAIGVVKSEGMVSPAYVSAVPDEKIYSEFMDYCLRRKQVIAQINNLSYGVTDFRKRLYWDSFVKVDVMLPSTPEQKKITDAFRNLDHLITLHQRKLEKMKNIKKSLLEKMFI